jgi:uncharacterized damage-inducible protein DinB
MAMIEALLGEYDHEMANTRRELERAPEDKWEWRPHPKSFSMGQLATHLATVPSWTVETLTKTELDVAPGGKPAPTPELAKSRAELLERFDSNVKAGRAALAAAKDQDLFVPWALLQNGKQIMSMPRAAVLRGFILSHVIHHRAQLGVYLRMNDVPVPAIYGPSADEAGF